MIYGFVIRSTAKAIPKRLQDGPECLRRVAALEMAKDYIPLGDFAARDVAMIDIAGGPARPELVVLPPSAMFHGEAHQLLLSRYVFCVLTARHSPARKCRRSSKFHASSRASALDFLDRQSERWYLPEAHHVNRIEDVIHICRGSVRLPVHDRGGVSWALNQDEAGRPAPRHIHCVFLAEAIMKARVTDAIMTKRRAISPTTRTSAGF